jgi:hypothetical protein
MATAERVPPSPFRVEGCRAPFGNRIAAEFGGTVAGKEGNAFRVDRGMRHEAIADAIVGKRTAQTRAPARQASRLTGRNRSEVMTAQHRPQTRFTWSAARRPLVRSAVTTALWGNA